MTLPDEERRALIYARDFLVSLLDPKKTPKVPKKIRQEAYQRLRHYPSDYRINELYANEYDYELYKGCEECFGRGLIVKDDIQSLCLSCMGKGKVQV
jgi:hypothetical protein